LRTAKPAALDDDVIQEDAAVTEIRLVAALLLLLVRRYQECLLNQGHTGGADGKFDVLGME
jgi:hypothetical protein